MNIWLLFHGKIEPDYPESHECLRIQEEAQKRGLNLEIMNPEQIELLVDSGGEWRAVHNGRMLGMPDVIVPRTGAETTYTGYSVMRFYECLGVPFLNTPRIVETVADKLHTMQILAARGIPVPRTLLGKFPPDIDMIERTLSFPLVVKTLRGTRGGGVFLAQTRQNFKDLTDLIAQANTDVHFIFQEYIAASHGRDLRVFVVNDKVLACMERQGPDGSFKSNISQGGTGRMFAPTPEVESLALKVTRKLRLEVAGIDLLFAEQGYIVCEANSSPGFAGLEAACSINAAAAIVTAAVQKAHDGKGRKSRISWSRLVSHLRRKPEKNRVSFSKAA